MSKHVIVRVPLQFAPGRAVISQSREFRIFNAFHSTYVRIVYIRVGKDMMLMGTFIRLVLAAVIGGRFQRNVGFGAGDDRLWGEGPISFKAWRQLILLLVVERKSSALRFPPFLGECFRSIKFMPPRAGLELLCRRDAGNTGMNSFWAQLLEDIDPARVFNIIRQVPSFQVDSRKVCIEQFHPPAILIKLPALTRV